MTTPSMIDVSRLRRLLEVNETEGTQAAFHALDTLEADELSVGRSAADSYSTAMRLKVERARGRGIEVRGWESLGRTLSEMDGQSIYGVVFGTTVIVVLNSRLDQVIGVVTLG